MLDNLKPISEQHSISRTIASIFIPQSFLKPEDIFEIVKVLEDFESYQKKVLLYSATVRIHNLSMGISEKQIRGFMFENYDTNGDLNHILKLENTTDNESIISLETRKYKNWDKFKTQLKLDTSSLSEKISFYIKAISLNYVDEFIWVSQDKQIDVNEIFNKNSELLNKKFLDSNNATLISISQGDDYEEKTEISFNNDRNRIAINHVYATKFKEIQLSTNLNSSNFVSLYDIPHKENKKILQDILTIPCQELINLK